MERQGETRESEIHLRDYWRILWGGRYTVLATFVIIVTVGVIATFLQTPIYRAHARLRIQARAANVAPVKDVSQIGTTDYGWSAEDRYFKTELEVLQSRDVAARAFERLGLDEHPRFREMEDPVAVIAAMLQIDPIDETNMVDLYMESPNAEEAAAWVNAMGDAYVQRNLQKARTRTRAALDGLLSEIDQKRENLEKTQKEMFSYAREHKVFVPEVQKRSYEERLSQLEKDHTTAQIHRLQLEAVFQKIKEIDDTSGNYQVIPQVAEDQILRDLNKQRIELETEYKKLLVSYKPGHFKVKETASELDKLEQKINLETERIISAIRTDYSLTIEREKDLGHAIEATKIEALDVTERVTAYTMLQTEAEELKRIYDMITGRVKEVNVSAALTQNNTWVVDYAMAPLHPSRPKKILNFALAVFLGLSLGVGLVFFLEYIDTTVRSADAVERTLGVKILTVVPTERPQVTAAVNEAFHMLRMGVQLASNEGERRVILITSATPGEGKSTVSVALARGLARGGEKVCLVDADLRRPSLHTVFSIASAPGLSNHVSGGEGPKSLRSYIQEGDVPGLSILPCGPLPPNPPELIATERFASLINDLKAEYDWVILDSAPMVGLADGPLLASMSDMAILVIRHAATDRDLARRAVADIERVKDLLIGAVLNDVDITRSDARSSYGAVYYPVPRVKKPEPAASHRRPAAL
jgi:capsular exopolysaccharide synthesis family protein